MILVDGNLVDANGARRGHPGASDLLDKSLTVLSGSRSSSATPPCWSCSGTADPHARQSARCSAGSSPTSPAALHARRRTRGSGRASARSPHVAPDPPPANREQGKALVVALAAAMATIRAHGRFFQHRRVTIRALGSPNTPLSVTVAAKPGKQNNSRRLRPVFIWKPRSQSQSRNRPCSRSRKMA